MVAFDARLGRYVMGHRGGEWLVDGDWLVAGQPAWPLVEAFGPHQVGVGCLGLLLSVGMNEGQNQAGYGDRAQAAAPC
jgi:hypothetical protein